jgi:hypothetical protein
MRSLVIGVLAALYLDRAAAQELKLTRTAVSGVDSLLAHEHAWDRNCNALETKITFTRMPAHGEVSITTGTSAVPDSVPRTGATGNCIGKMITGNEVMYKSEPGYQGMDAVSYVVVYPNGNRSPTSITITVN